MASTAPAQNHGCGKAANATSSDSVSTGATRLRRRLSNSFQRDRADSGLASRRPPGSGTRPRSQAMICQSPRIQRWRRPMSSR